MALPNGDRAIVELHKLTDYCLSSLHPRGRHKARVFAASLGLTESDAAWLHSALLAAARTESALALDTDEYGARYRLDFTLERTGRQARIRSFWMIRKGESVPRLTTCYVL